jgi:hypothetical protein
MRKGKSKKEKGKRSTRGAFWEGGTRAFAFAFSFLLWS